MLVTHSYGFLTYTLEYYLNHSRTDLKSKKRAIYDFHIRRNLEEALKDAIFVLEKMDKKQFDKISDQIFYDIVGLAMLFAERNYVGSPIGRIRKYKKLVYGETILRAASFFMDLGILILTEHQKEREKERKLLSQTV